MSPSLLAQASFAFQSGKPVTAVMRCSSSADGGSGPVMTALGEPALPLASEIRSARSRSDSGAGGGSSSTCGSGSGAATAGEQLSEMLPDGVDGMVDFNPVADRIRVMGTDGTNLRIHPDTGETTVDGSLNFEAGDENADATPNVVATAYTNSIGTPEATAMYDIDAGLGALLRQTAPNDGTLATLGSLGIEGADTYALVIQATAEGENTAWLVAGNGLYTVDLETGATEMVAEITGADGDIRWVDLDDSLMAALALPSEQRSEETQTELHARFMKTAPELAKKIRMSAARDITWALINSPAFLYNR